VNVVHLTRIFAFTDSGLVDWQGTYDDFVERYVRDEERASDSTARRRSLDDDAAHAFALAE